MRLVRLLRTRMLHSNHSRPLVPKNATFREEATKWADNNSDFSNSKRERKKGKFFFLRQFAKKERSC